MSQESNVSAGTVLNGRYTVLEKLGSPGRSRTYHGHDDKADQDVALKILGLGDLADWSEMDSFDQEISVLKSLEHPNIPEYLDSFRTTVGQDEFRVLVTEFLAGENLLDLIGSGQRVSEQELQDLITSVLETLGYIHELHPPLLHLTVSPENIVLSDRWCLVDFDTTGGSQNTSSTSPVSAEDAFVAPEVHSGHPVPQSDLYSFGKCLQFVLTGDANGDLAALRREPGDKTIDFVVGLTNPVVAKRYPTARAALDEYLKQTVTRKERTEARKQAARKKAKGKRAKKKTKNKARKKSPVTAGKVIWRIFVTACIVVPLGYLGYSAVSAVVGQFRIKAHAPVVEASVDGDIVELKTLLDAGKSPNARDTAGFSALNLALIYSQDQAARLLIQSGADVDYVADHDTIVAGPAISVAAHYGAITIIDLLCDSGAVLDVRDRTGATPLTVVTENGSIEGVRRLIEGGSSVDFPDSSGTPPLIFAIHQGQVAIARLLIDAGARADQTRTGDNYSALQAAYYMYSRSGRREREPWVALIGLMIESSSEFEFRSDQVTFALLQENRDDYGIVSVLLDSAADLDSVDADGRTALMLATLKDRTDTAGVLLKLGADPDYRDNANQSPLIIARQRGNRELVDILKQYNAQEVLSERSILGAARYGDLDAVRYLVEHGVSIHSKDSQGHSVFVQAVISGDAALIEYVESNGGTGAFSDELIFQMVQSNMVAGVAALLRRGYDLDIEDYYNGTTLEVAVDHGHADMAHLLWEAGVDHGLTDSSFVREIRRNEHQTVAVYLRLGFDPNLPDRTGDSPLNEAADAGAHDSARVLLDAGAHVDWSDNRRNTALFDACDGGYYPIAELLISRGADPNSINTVGHTPLMAATWSGDIKAVRHLVEHGARINTQADTGESALSFAVHHQETDVALYLISAGADVNVVFYTSWSARRGNTPLRLARYNNNVTLIDALLQAGAR